MQLFDKRLITFFRASRKKSTGAEISTETAMTIHHRAVRLPSFQVTLNFIAESKLALTA